MQLFPLLCWEMEMDAIPGDFPISIASFPTNCSVKFGRARSFQVDRCNRRFSTSAMKLRGMFVWGGKEAPMIKDAFLDACKWMGEDPAAVFRKIQRAYEVHVPDEHIGFSGDDSS